VATTSEGPLAGPAETELNQLLGGIVQKILPTLVGKATSDRVAEHVGEAYLACERAARARPREFRAALEAGRAEAFLTPAVQESLRGERSEEFRGGWMGVFLGPDGRPVETGAAEEGIGADRIALETSHRALRKAFSRAAAEDNRTMARNLNWYCERLASKTYEAIADAAGKPPATIRTGVARAKKLVLRIVHELENAQPAPLNGQAPEALEGARRLWAEQDLDALDRELERTRPEFADDPHWLNLAALLAADRKQRERAHDLYERALVFADAPSVRGRVLNNLGNLLDDEAQSDAAELCWQRASQLVPAAPAPLLNLLALASTRRNYASAQHYISRIADLLNAAKLTDEERAYLCRRLRAHPRLSWLRQTEAWRLGPARWIRAEQAERRGPRTTATAVIVALLLGAAIAVGSSFLGSPAARSTASESQVEQLQLWAGGDSMGKSTGTPNSGRPSGKRRGV
jgi:tetratricopeptide (TPR) repeat protein